MALELGRSGGKQSSSLDDAGSRVRKRAREGSELLPDGDALGRARGGGGESREMMNYVLSIERQSGIDLAEAPHAVPRGLVVLVEENMALDGTTGAVGMTNEIGELLVVISPVHVVAGGDAQPAQQTQRSGRVEAQLVRDEMRDERIKFEWNPRRSDRIALRQSPSETVEYRGDEGVGD